MNYIQKYQQGNSVSSVATEYKFRDPVNKEKYDDYKKSLEANDYLKERARLYYYKQKLDPVLRNKNIKSYDNYVASRPTGYKESRAAADKAYEDKTYSDYLSVDDIKKSLGDEYQDYEGLMSKHQADLFGIKGQHESGKTMPDLKYGLRTSELLQPYTYNMIVKSYIDRNQDAAKFSGKAVYNPADKSYSYDYAQPEEFTVRRKGEFFKQGGKLVSKYGKGNKVNYIEKDQNNFTDPVNSEFGPLHLDTIYKRYVHKPIPGKIQLKKNGLYSAVAGGKYGKLLGKGIGYVGMFSPIIEILADAKEEAEAKKDPETYHNYLRDKAAARYQVTGSVKDYFASQGQFL